MSELEEKLENILGNPQAMAQIMSLAQSLNIGGQGETGQTQPQAGQTQSPPEPPSPSAESGETPPASPPPASPAGNGLGGLLGGLNSLDPKMLSAAASLMGQFSNDSDDKRVALLTALRPFVKEERYAKLDKAVQIAKLSRLIRSGLDLFRARKEDGHV